MTRQLLTGNGAAAWGARLAEIDYVPAFPNTDSTQTPINHKWPSYPLKDIAFVSEKEKETPENSINGVVLSISREFIVRLAPQRYDNPVIVSSLTQEIG